MASRLQQITVNPWKAGLNTAENPTFLQLDELQIAENVVFDATNGTRRTRDAFRFFDYVATGVTRASSGTTRTMVATRTTGQTLANGDSVSIWHTDANNLNYDIKTVTIGGVSLAGSDYTFTYTASTGLTETTTADTAFRVGKFVTENMIGFYDFHYFTAGAKVQARVGVSSAGRFYKYASDGAKTAITVDGTVSLTTPLTYVSFATLGNLLVMSFNGANVPLKWAGGATNILPLTNTNYAGADVTANNAVPNLGYIRVHQNRLLGTDKNDPDRLHYSDVDNAERWAGEGDSGAIDFPADDNDVTGLTTIMPSFRGDLMVSRLSQTYRVVGQAPFWEVQKITDVIGSVSHLGASQVDTNDLVFVSKKGIHSIVSSQSYGAFEGTYLSKPIQGDFNALDQSATSLIRSIYLPQLNSVIFSFRESGQSSNNTLYGLNINPLDQTNPAKWYKFLKVSDSLMTVECLGKFSNLGSDVFLIGTSGGRLLKYDSNWTQDLINETINFRIKSGIIYPDKNPAMVKGFKKAGIIYKTQLTNVSITANFRVDNFATQSTALTQESNADLLNTSFVLGTSLLGTDAIILPEYFSVDGYGFGCTLDLLSTTYVEVYGYIIEYELAGDSSDVIRSG